MEKICLVFDFDTSDADIVPAGQNSLLGVARHEFGHAMSLRHVLNPTDLMYITQAPNFCNVIHTDDADGGRYELATVAPFVSPIPPNPQQYPLNCPGTVLNGIENAESSNHIATSRTVTYDNLEKDIFQVIETSTGQKRKILGLNSFERAEK